MKTIARKLNAYTSAETLRNISISLFCVALVAVTLYILINSPA